MSPRRSDALEQPEQFRSRNRGHGGAAVRRAVVDPEFVVVLDETGREDDPGDESVPLEGFQGTEDRLRAAGQNAAGILGGGEKRTPEVAADAGAAFVEVKDLEPSLGGKTIRYQATAGTLPLRDAKGKPTAEIFFVAYTEEGGANAASRPVTFVFNGGPGAASVWLHLGALGPRRTVMTDSGVTPPPPPGKVVDNQESWLGFTDLVFIDPVGTGYSRPAKGHKQSEFSGLEEDTRAVADFLRLYATRYRRWGSPKFLVGESYGTTRAANLAGYLQERYGMNLNGVVLISPVLDFRTIRFGGDNDLPYVLFLPSYTATAWYHRRLAPELMKDLDATLRQAEAFASGSYAPALARGSALPVAERNRIAQVYARLTGLGEDFVLRSDLRVSMGRFGKELLRSKRRTVGRLDSRVVGIDRDSAGSRSEYDPAMWVVKGAFSAAFLAYVGGELGYRSDLTYETLGSVGRWKVPEGRYVNVAGSLRGAMTRNPHLKLLVACGHFDLATPFYAADYTLRHLGLDETLQSHVRLRTYEAGHMMYVNAPSRKKLATDAAEFYAWKP